MDGTDAPQSLALARAALAEAPAGLLTDFDGTLSPIVADPAAARPVPGAVEALESLSRRLALVAVVTGRSALAARALLGSDRVEVIGNHGLERLSPGAAAPTFRPDLSAAAESVARLAAAVPREPGVSVELKGLSATVHLRNAADPEAAGRRVLAALRAAAEPEVEVRPGRMSLELRPAGAGDKGSALVEAAERHGLRGLVVLGDDVTDLDMFRAAAGLRSAGRLRAAILAVRGGDEVPAEVEAAADAVVGSPRDVVLLLQELAAG